MCLCHIPHPSKANVRGTSSFDPRPQQSRGFWGWRSLMSPRRWNLSYFPHLVSIKASTAR